MNKRLLKYIKLSWEDETCLHAGCSCKLTATGIHNTTLPFNVLADTGDPSRNLNKVLYEINRAFIIVDGIPRFREGDYEIAKMKVAVSKKASFVPVKSPFHSNRGWPMSSMLGSADRRVVRALALADAYQLQHKLGRFAGWSELLEAWTPIDPNKCESLQTLVIRKFSQFWQVFGTVNGRKFVTAATEALYPDKYTDALLNMNKETQKPPAEFETLRPMIPTAMDILYHHMGIHEFGNERSKLHFAELGSMYLGASRGLNPGDCYIIHDPSLDVPVFIKGTGKKSDLFEADLDAILEMIRTGEYVPVFWDIVPKVENFYKWDCQNNDEKYKAWKSKLRLFVIPSSIFILVERLVSKIRHLKERGRVIAVGHSGTKGGMDKIARMLGITLENCEDPILEEGDAKNFDQSVLADFVKLYFSTMLIHERTDNPDYKIKEFLLKWLTENIVTRLTRVFADYWCVLRGGVPSGCFNTSHMDSWIMAMYFFCFAVYQLLNALPEDQEELEHEILNVIKLICYGDDHLWNRGSGIASRYLTAHQFAAFCKKFFRVEVRDIFSGLPFLSKEKWGYITRRGACFLKHYAILNTDKRPGQSKFVPYRETREHVARVVYGRETSERDIQDVLLSTVGHAYGTYGCNKDAYDFLLSFSVN